MSGRLTEGAWPTLLHDLYVHRRSGVLRLKQGGAFRQVRFAEGQPVFARSSVAGEDLGDWLAATGRVSQIDHERATAMARSERRPLGQALIELGALERQQLDEALNQHLTEQLQHCVDGADGEWEFEEQPPAADEDASRGFATAEFIQGLVRGIRDADVVRFGLGDRDRILGLSTDPLLRFQKIKLSPDDGYVLSRVDGTLSAREITQIIPLLPEEVERSLLALLCTGVIEYLPLPPRKPVPPRPLVRPAELAPGTPAVAPPAEREPPRTSPETEARRKEILAAVESLKGANHFELLGIPRSSNEAQVKEAYFRLARRFHPDSIRKDAALQDLAEQAESVFIRIGEAAEVLRDAKRRASYEADLATRAPRVPVQPKAPAEAPPPAAAPAEADPEADARAVDQAAKVGERLIAEEKYWDAIQLLESALPNAQGKTATRVRYLLAKAFIKNPHWVRRAEEMLQIVVRDEPQHVGGHVMLGQIYKRGGLRARATSMFKRVLELQPDHEEATHALQELLQAPAPEASESAPEPPPQPQGGLLKRLFGKG